MNTVLRYTRLLALGLCSLLLLALQVQAQPVNDDLADAIEVTSMPFSDTGTNVGATSETDEELAYNYNTVWWKVTPSQAGVLTVDTYGSSFDTVLSLWTGTGHPLTSEALNNDADGTEQSELAMTVAAGETYYIRVRGYYSSYEGDISLHVALDPPIVNDHLANATAITSLPFSGTGTNVGATVETDEAEPSYECARGDAIENSVWWKYTPTQEGILTVDTGGSSFNNVVSVWTGTGHPLTQEACDRQTSTTTNQATAKLAVVTGETYYIRVAGMYAYGRPQEGDVSLSVTREPPITNDNLSGATAITTLPFATTGSNYGATLESSETLPSCAAEGDKSVWWAYTPSSEGILVIDASGSDLIDPALSLWTGSGHPLTEQNCAATNDEQLSHPVTAGTTYYIRVSDSWPASYPSYEVGDIHLNISLAPPVANDDLADATAITSLPFSDTGSNVGATSEAGEAHSTCTTSDGATNSVWWTYTPSQDGVLTVDTDGSDFDRVLGIWTGTGHPLTELDCTDDSPEKLARSVSAGETYYIRVSGYSDSGEGDIVLSASLAPSLPNDDLADAIEIASTPYSTTATLVGATLETDEVITNCGDESGLEGSVWWTYTATHTGELTIDTGGSNFDLVLSVWTGTSHPLDRAGCTDSDSGGTLEVAAGETYLIRISNYYPDEVGDISLEATFALPDPVYVDLDATGANDGSSWADAYTDLHDALADGDPQIWVAEGTYSNGLSSFELPDGVAIYGGFNGTETARLERDPAQHEVVLTGSADHVLYARSVGGSTRLDGLTVSGGTADGGGEDSDGAGLYCDGRAIYGTFSGGCSLTIANVIFENNNADGDGGAIYLDGREGSANAMLVGITFRGNSGTHGGALHVNAEDGFASPVLQNVVFADNSAGNGGAVYLQAPLEGTASPQFDNVLFANNTALAGGGAVYTTQAGGTGGWATPSFTNVTFFGNAADQGHAIWNYGLGGGEAAVSLYNVIAWNNINDAHTGGRFHNAGIATTGFVDAIVESASSMCFLSAVSCTRVREEDPDFRADWNPDGVDGTFRTGDDGLRLASYSPAIDAGNNLLSTAASDLAGRPRVFGGAIDLGAYEHSVYQSESDAPGVGSGTGFYLLGSSGATVLFRENTSTSGGLSGSLTTNAPTGSGLPPNLVPKFWTITESLDGAFTYNVTFDLTGVSGVNSFDSLKVYKSDDGGQTWAAVDSLIHNEADMTITAAHLTSFSQFAVGGTAAALPVELARLEAARDGEVVRLAWQTASETSNDHFAVQRSTDAGDWTTLGTVEGAGTTSEAQSYSFVDEDVPFEAEVVRYRLRQTDFDGTTHYTDEVEVAAAVPEAFALHGSFPNPFAQATTIRYELPEAAHVTLHVYDALGRRVRTLVDARQEAGRHALRFDGADLPSGLYLYRMQADEHTQTRRLTIVR